MSVTEVKLSSLGASGSATGTSPLNVSASFTSNYTVTCSDQSDAPNTVLAYFAQTSSLPWMGRSFKFGNGFDGSVFCKSVTANYVDKSAGKFVVTCNFESLQGNQNDQQQGKDANGKTTQDPRLWHDEIEFSFTTVTEAVDQATFRKFVNGAGTNFSFKPDQLRAVTNSAGIPFDPPLTKEVSIRVIRISKYSAKCEAIKGAKYLNAINSESFDIEKPAYGFTYPVGAYNGKIVNFSTTFAIENNIKFWKETIELHVHPNGWRRQVLDLGLHRGQNATNGDLFDSGSAISPSDEGTANWTPYVPIKGSDGQPITVPVPLDGKGQPLKSGKSHVYIVYSVEKEMSFGGIKW